MGVNSPLQSVLKVLEPFALSYCSEVEWRQIVDEVLVAGNVSEVSNRANEVLVKAKFASKSEAAKFAAQQRWKNHQKKQAVGVEPKSKGKKAVTRPKKPAVSDSSSKFKPMSNDEMNDLQDAAENLHGRFFPGRTNFQVLPEKMPKNLTGKNATVWAAYALEAYQLSAYRNMNAYLRGEDAVDSDGFFEDSPVKTDNRAADLLKSHFDDLAIPMPRDTVVYRGIVLPEDEDWEPGEEFLDPAFVSTSMAVETAKKFSEEVDDDQRSILMEIRIPKGHKVCVPIGAHGNEREILMRPGTTFKLVEVQKNGVVEKWVVEVVTK